MTTCLLRFLYPEVVVRDTGMSAVSHMGRDSETLGIPYCEYINP